MIKLNNKNITYVALADSNNSLKAPKEIWYADSSNSVKLVYRRKDALIEGEDYEKYHWLVGDADAYINTLKYYRPYDDSVQMTFRDNLYPNRVNKYNKHNAEEQIWGGSMKDIVYSIRSYISGTEDNKNKISNTVLDARTTDGNVNWGVYAIRSFINASPEHSLYISSVDANTDKYYFIYNGDTKDNLPTRYTLPELIEQDVLVFYNASVTNGYFNGSFFNFIHYRNNVEITHLIPCKLLKPVPKWLDANGIRRQVGECGMIDLISGKFYGNVNGVGTFTVENYYERKEWLQGDYVAYIDTNVIVNVATLLISTKIKRSNSTDNYFIFGSRDIARSDDPSTSSVVVSPQSFRCDIIDGNNIFDSSSTASIELSFPTLTINGQSVTTQRVPTTSQNTFRIFTTSVVNSDTYCFNGGISEFVLNDGSHSLNLIPCTLTMDLPASMDANNIARTKGTSGMWDLVSDRFYGNVANSGTFKAVNLAEGVDYEVHQWLVIQYLGGEQATLPIQSNDFNYKYKFYSFGNIGGILTTNNDYIYYSHVGSNGIWGKSERNSVYRGKFYELNKEISINCDANGITMDGELMPNYGSSPYFDNLKIYCYGSTTAKYALSSVTVDGIERYIPVKLLKSIPSKYDANGIARQAGECGMYDTVNDLFYGNVASSGNFSVSDDN